MAKAKKNESAAANKSPAGGKSAAKKPAGKKSDKSAKPASAGGATPLINTDLAAAAAARMLAARNQLKAQADEKQEGSLLKQIKQELNKSTPASMAHLLDKTGGSAGGKRPNLPFGGGNQVGHNQTIGGNVNRTAIPRRTSG